MLLFPVVMFSQGPNPPPPPIDNYPKQVVTNVIDIKLKKLKTFVYDMVLIRTKPKVRKV